MLLDRRYGNDQFVGNLLVRKSGFDESQDFKLALRQRFYEAIIDVHDGLRKLCRQVYWGCTIPQMLKFGFDPFAKWRVYCDFEHGKAIGARDMREESHQTLMIYKFDGERRHGVIEPQFHLTRQILALRVKC